jgi:hypothetical protein
MKTHTLDNGVKVVTFSPAKHFNPLTASNAELAANGFPVPPRDARHQDRFRKVMGRLKGKFHYVEPTFKVNAGITHGPRSRRSGLTGPAAGTETSSNWSGAVVYAPAGDSFKWIEGDWVVPDVAAPATGQEYYCATWIGIDGDGSDDVFQAGVESQVSAGGQVQVYPWWEWYPTPEIQITNLEVSPGDMVTMLLCSAEGAGSTTGTVFFTNRTTGASTSIGLIAPAGTQLAGNSAEWIVEAPTVNGSQSALADYGEVFFSVCDAYTVGGVTVEGGTGNNINMTAGGSDVSDAILVTPTIVQCEYVGTLP